MSLYIGKAAKAVGVSAATLKRWFRSDKVHDVARDRNGYRIFGTDDIERLRAYANQRFEPPLKNSAVGTRQSAPRAQPSPS